MLASIALILWPTIVSDRCPINENTTIVGIAYDTKHQLLYCERVTQWSEEQLHIDYLSNHKIFATKDLFIVSTPEKPQVIQKDFRSGEIRQAIITTDKIQLLYKEKTDSAEKRVDFDNTEMDVVDAGFNEFIRNHWQDLLGKRYTPIKFGSIAHLKSLNLRIHQQSIEQCSPQIANNKLETCFIVEIDNFLLRMLLGKMQLIYDDQHRLKNYLGPVNITTEKGDTQNASIDYYYAIDYTPPQK